MKTRLYTPLLAVLSLFLLLSPATANADEWEHLKPVERDYVDKISKAYGTALGVATDIDEMLAGGSFEAAFGEGTLEPSMVVGALASANSLLATSAETLREAPPTSMAGLRGTNQDVAAVLEEGYHPCEGEMSEASGVKAVEWGKGVMEEIFGVAPDTEEGDTASAARVISCIEAQNTKVKEAIHDGLGAMDERVKEIAEEDELERDLFGDIVGAECFIATAAYGTQSAEEIQVLRDFRDDVLLKSEAGRDYVGFYYAVSPPIADFIAAREWLRTPVRELLVDPIVWATRTASPLWSPS